MALTAMRSSSSTIASKSRRRSGSARHRLRARAAAGQDRAGETILVGGRPPGEDVVDQFRHRRKLLDTLHLIEKIETIVGEAGRRVDQGGGAGVQRRSATSRAGPLNIGAA